MASETPLQVSLRDPLSQVTRGERRMLLGVSVLSIFIARTGLIPTKISALGVELGASDQRAFLLVMSGIVAYFVIGFVLYGLTDFLAWRISYNEGAKVMYREMFGRVQRRSEEERDADYVHDWAPRWPNHLALPASLGRATFEFLLPVAVGAYAVYALLSAVA